MSFHFPVAGTSIRVNALTVKVQSILSESSSSSVSKCTDPRGRDYALKAIPIPTKCELQAILSEHKTHEILCVDPHIVTVFGCAVDQKSRIGYILLELCTSTLASATQTTILPKPQMIEIFESVCAAVHFLHSQVPPIIHRDISPTNVLLSSTGWKLSDFGSATTTVFSQFDDANKLKAIREEIDRCVAPALRPPEMVDFRACRPIGPKADVWALGLLLFRLCTGRDGAADGVIWPTDIPIDERLQRIVNVALATDPDARPTVAQLLGILHAEFPQLVDPRWHEFAPKRPIGELTIRARSGSRKANAKTFQPMAAPLEEPVAEPRARGNQRKVRHGAMDLGDAAAQLAMIGEVGTDQVALLAALEGKGEAAARGRRVRRAVSSGDGEQ